MRSFQQLLVVLFAFFTFAIAQDTQKYDATVYITSTVYRVSSITVSGTPTGPVQNTTSTISAIVTPVYSAGRNGTTVAPTGSAPASSSPAPSSSSPADFPGAASSLNVNALVALVAVGLGFLAL